MSSSESNLFHDFSIVQDSYLPLCFSLTLNIDDHHLRQQLHQFHIPPASSHQQAASSSVHSDSYSSKEFIVFNILQMKFELKLKSNFTHSQFT